MDLGTPIGLAFPCRSQGREKIRSDEMDLSKEHKKDYTPRGDSHFEEAKGDLAPWEKTP